MSQPCVSASVFKAPDGGRVFSVTASSRGVTSGPPSRPSPVFCQWAAGSWSRWSAAAGCSLELGSWKNRLSPGSSFTATCRDTVSRTWRNTLPSSPRKVGAGEGSRWPQSRTAAKALPSVEPSVPMLGSQFLQTSVPSSCCLGSLTPTRPGSGMRSRRRHGTGRARVTVRLAWPEPLKDGLGLYSFSGCI